MTSTLPDDTSVDRDDVSPLSSQTVGVWGSPLATVDTAEPILEDSLFPLNRARLPNVRRLFRNGKFEAGLILFGIIAILVILAPLISRYSPTYFPDSFTSTNQNPSLKHWLGTDYLGRDIWSRLLWGGRTSLPAGAAAVLLSLSIGIPWGIVAGFGHRLVDDLLMRLIDVLLAFPGIVLIYGIVAILGAGIESVVIALGIASIPGYARVARASTLSTKTLDYVEAARAQGGGSIHIMRRHVLPNIVDPIVILGTLNLAGAILATSALSFLGIGTQLPGADWGTMLSSGFNYMFLSWSQVVFPGLFIIVSVLGINLMGDALGEAINRSSGIG